jgi:hypothetical protein
MMDEVKNKKDLRIKKDDESMWQWKHTSIASISNPDTDSFLHEEELASLRGVVFLGDRLFG